ncbi:hypothetical protein LUZ60_012448 [Juncus effusus]|nr:hypothetical protein LUZ60_012448 [Juncus effusus]
MVGSITHFLHPQHQLLISKDGTNYACNMCDVVSSGRRYHCDTCDFDLHECCANYPETLDSFFAHPWHTLYITADSEGERYCDLCVDRVQGFYYSCILCGFDMHLHCSLLSQTVKTEFHPAHPLILVPSGPDKDCVACGESKGIWSYTCGLCAVKLHVKCFIESKVGSNGQKRHHHRLEKFMGELGKAFLDGAAEGISSALS